MMNMRYEEHLRAHCRMNTTECANFAYFPALGRVTGETDQ